MAMEPQQASLMYKMDGTMLGFPTGWDSTTFRDNGTEVSSFFRDKGTTGQAQNLAKEQDGTWDGMRF